VDFVVIIIIIIIIILIGGGRIDARCRNVGCAVSSAVER
jgi:hypothetical protein